MHDFNERCGNGMKIEFTPEELKIISKYAYRKVHNKMHNMPEEYSAEDEQDIKFYSTFGMDNPLANYIADIIMNYEQANYSAGSAEFKLRECRDVLYKVLGDVAYQACPGSSSSPIGRYMWALGFDLQENLACLETNLQDKDYVQRIYDGDKMAIKYLLDRIQHIISPDIPYWLKSDPKLNKENKDEN
jgi:hypothetical protein